MWDGRRWKEDGPGSSDQKPFCARLEILPSGKSKGKFMFAGRRFDSLSYTHVTMLLLISGTLTYRSHAVERLSLSLYFDFFFSPMFAYGQLSYS